MTTMKENQLKLSHFSIRVLRILTYTTNYYVNR